MMMFIVMIDYPPFLPQALLPSHAHMDMSIRETHHHSSRNTTKAVFQTSSHVRTDLKDGDEIFHRKLQDAARRRGHDVSRSHRLLRSLLVVFVSQKLFAGRDEGQFSKVVSALEVLRRMATGDIFKSQRPSTFRH